MGFVYAFVLDFVYLLDFVGKFSYFDMVEIVAVTVCDILQYIVQKYLVDDNHRHQMINSLCMLFIFILLKKWVIFTIILWRVWIISKIYQIGRCIWEIPIMGTYVI